MASTSETPVNFVDKASSASTSRLDDPNSTTPTSTGEQNANTTTTSSDTPMTDGSSHDNSTQESTCTDGTLNQANLSTSLSSSEQNDPSSSESCSGAPNDTNNKPPYHQTLLTFYTNNKRDIATATIKQIIKILQNIQKKPQDKKLRQHPLQGIIIKKFIVGIPHGIELMKSLGFIETTVDNKPYLVLDDDNHYTLIHINDVINELEASIITPPQPPAAPAATSSANTSTTTTGANTTKSDQPPQPAQKCLADCGFFGSADKGGYCSVCFKKFQILLPSNDTTTSSSLPPLVSADTPIVTGSNSNKVTFKCSTQGCPYPRWSGTTQQALDLSFKLDKKNDTSDKAMSDDTPAPAAVATVPTKTPTIATKRPIPCCRLCIISSHNRRGTQTVTTSSVISPPRKNAKEKFATAMSKLTVVNVMNKTKRPSQTDISRCYECSRKLHLSSIQCRCGYHFCSKHRYPQEHNCLFDHLGRQITSLEKSNMTIKHSKLDDEHEE